MGREVQVAATRCGFVIHAMVNSCMGCIVEAHASSDFDDYLLEAMPARDIEMGLDLVVPEWTPSEPIQLPEP